MKTTIELPEKIAVSNKTNTVYPVDTATDKIDLQNPIEWPANTKAYKKYGANNYFTLYELKKQAK